MTERDPETMDVRPDEALDTSRLEPWLQEAPFCEVSSHTGAIMDAWDMRARTGPAAEAGLMSMSMSSPEEELAVVVV